VWLAFLSLAKKERAIIYLYYYERYSAAQTADILKISEAAVRKRLERARASLRGILGKDFD
jgi:RNA polymerase sigma-70 factor (ECF subfamily)